MCSNCIIAMLLGMFICWRMIEEDKKIQSFEDMQDEMIKTIVKGKTERP